MFSEQTEREIVNALTADACGQPVVLSNLAYRELLYAARCWDAGNVGRPEPGEAQMFGVPVQLAGVRLKLVVKRV